MSRLNVHRLVAAVLACSVYAFGCSDATQIQLLEIPGSGFVTGVAYLDLDFTGTPTLADEPLAGVVVEVVGLTSTTVVGSVTTDTAGVFTTTAIPVGDYRIRFVTGVVGDTLEAVGADSTITVVAGDTATSAIGATFPTLSLTETLSAPAGRMVFTSGIALNARVPFDSTGRVHLAAEGTALRALSVERSDVATGDSVRFLGRTGLDAGRPVLSDVRALLLIRSAAVVDPIVVSTRDASTAQDTVLDAALVQVQNAEISDTMTTADGNFHFWLDDGSDSVEVVVRGFLGVDHTSIRPDTTIRVSRLAGLLSPVLDGGGELSWQLLPRGGSDILLETKRANLSMSMTVDTTVASLGDTLAFTVVVANAGPLTATGVTVVDSVPSQTVFRTSTQTQGSYDPVSALWTVGDLAAGAADTLRLQLEVIDSIQGQFFKTTRSGGLVFEVDPDGSNNFQSIVITIPPPPLEQ